MMEQVITKVLMGMMGKGIEELKTVLYCVLSGYDIAEKSTELQSIQPKPYQISWREVYSNGGFLWGKN